MNKKIPLWHNVYPKKIMELESKMPSNDYEIGEYYGVLLPSNWDNSGILIEYSLHTTNEREFIIDPDCTFYIHAQRYLQQFICIDGSLSIKRKKKYLYVWNFYFKTFDT